MGRVSIMHTEDALESDEVYRLVAPVACQDRVGTQDKRVALGQAETGKKQSATDYPLSGASTKPK